MGARKLGILTTCYPREDADLAGHFIENAARLFKAAGYEVRVEAPHHPGAPTNEIKATVPVHRFRYAWPESLERLAYGSGIVGNLQKDPAAWFALPGLLLTLWSAARRIVHGTDLVHAHWIPAGIFALLARSARGPAIVVTVRGSDMPLARRIGWIRAVLARADAIIAVSETMRAELESLGLPKDRLTVVRESVDRLAASGAGDRPAARRRLGLAERPTITFLGRLSHVKGPDVLLRAVSRGLLQELDAQLVLMGDGNMEASLRELAPAAGEGRVRFAGFVPHRHVSDWLAATDLLVMPSRSEGLPVALVEAMSFGIPAVASRVGGIPELIVPGETGWLVPPEDDRALEEALRDALSGSASLQSRGDAARQKIEGGGFNDGQLQIDLERIYSAALSARSARMTAEAATSSQSNR